MRSKGLANERTTMSFGGEVDAGLYITLGLTLINGRH